MNEAKPVSETDSAAIFRVPLKAGRTDLAAHFTDVEGRPLCAAFFVTVRAK